GLRTVIIPAANLAELSEIPEHVTSRVQIIPAKTMNDVLQVALVRSPRVQRRSAGSSATTSSRSRGRPSARA
ncbi:MAG TPA: S16 family serine protease, partial [Polyangia bacterium]